MKRYREEQRGRGIKEVEWAEKDEWGNEEKRRDYHVSVREWKTSKSRQEEEREEGKDKEGVR